MNVEHEARRLAAGQGVEEGACGGEALDDVAVRLHQAMERSKGRGIVVDDGDEAYVGHREDISPFTVDRATRARY